jgi:hypothetical protein
MAKIILCVLKKDYPFEEIPGSVVMPCDHCQEAIWAAKSTLEMRDEAFILCQNCCRKIPNLQFGGITDMQKDELGRS